jgi:hypothetical protein
MVRYDNFIFMVSFEYPESWKAIEDDYLIDGKPTRFEGDSGFFQVAGGGGQNTSLDEFAADEAKHKLNPYGSDPEIEKIDVHSREAALIFPSSDQPEEMNNQACLIIKYPHEVIIDNKEYNYVILWADKNHIRDMADSFYFISYSQDTTAQVENQATSDDIIMYFFELIDQDKSSEAVDLLDSSVAPDPDTKKQWKSAFDGFESAEVISKESFNEPSWTDDYQIYKVTINIKIKPDRLEELINWDGQSVRWISIIKNNGIWKIGEIATGP